MVKFSTRRIVVLATLTAVALIMFMVESLFPPLFFPGAKMGISNICTLLCLVMLTPFDAIILIIIRTTLGSLFSSGISTLVYSLPAGMISVVVSSLLMLFHPKISLVAISITSAVIHNITQNLIFVWISGVTLMLNYMPYLSLIGVLAGFIVGIATYFLVKAIPQSTFNTLYDSINYRS